MMKIALFADIHGNFVALEAVLKDIQQQAVDQVSICLVRHGLYVQTFIGLVVFAVHTYVESLEHRNQAVCAVGIDSECKC